MPLSVLYKTAKKSTALWAVGLLFSFSVQAANLSDIQQQIQQQEQKIAEQKREQDQLQSALKSHETKMNDVIGGLRQTENDLKETRKLIKEAEKQIKQLEKQEKAQKAKLAKQLDSIYRSGNPSSVIEHLIANDAQHADRMKVYYQHMNKARMDLIADLKATRAQLDEQKQAMATQQQEQQTQISEQKKQQKELQKTKNERQSTLNKLNKSLARDENRLETLKANERALQQQIQDAEQVSHRQEQREREALVRKTQAEEKKTNKPYQPTEQEKQLISSGKGLQGKYAYPVAGKILHRFGSTQVGELKWKGVVISANAGTPVKAIANGRVIIANWLQGYGLLIVLAHGNGDMSLYGYNQAVSVKEGSLVRAGQKIAEVGNSGGQDQAALYFEIRRQGKAVNPLSWLQ